jgi:hypothetical protein
MKNRVKQQESIERSLERIPFLKHFYSYGLNAFLTGKINEYMGYCYVTLHTPLTSMSINKILEEAEKRGDI